MTTVLEQYYLEYRIFYIVLRRPKLIFLPLVCIVYFFQIKTDIQERI